MISGMNNGHAAINNTHNICKTKSAPEEEARIGARGAGYNRAILSSKAADGFTVVNKRKQVSMFSGSILIFPQ